MGKYLLVFIVILIISSFGVIAIDSENCADSDNGKDYYVKGFASSFTNTGDKYSQTDTCCKYESGADNTENCLPAHEADYLIEEYCGHANPDDGKEYAYPEIYKCPLGCKDGVCLTEKSSEPEKPSEPLIKVTISEGRIFKVGEFLTINYCGTDLDFKNDAFAHIYLMQEDSVIALIANTESGITSCSDGQSIFSWKIGEFPEGVPNQIPATGLNDNNYRILVDYREKSGKTITQGQSNNYFGIVSPPECKDSDNGKNYYTKGYISYHSVSKGQSISGDDSCVGSEVAEWYCQHDGNYNQERFLCPYGCEDGACKQFVEKNEVIDILEDKSQSSTTCKEKMCEEVSEKCFNKDKIVVEECKIYIDISGNCAERTIINSKVIKDVCDQQDAITNKLNCQGCLIDKDTCIPFGVRLEKTDLGYYCNINKIVSKQKDNKDSCQNSYECISNNCASGTCKSVCEGCLNENNICIPIGTRTETQYCDIEYSFKDQKLEDNNCNNNYECSSNVCVNNKCISPSLLQKIIDWFKKLFG